MLLVDLKRGYQPGGVLLGIVRLLTTQYTIARFIDRN
jgi:hypothetical protein